MVCNPFFSEVRKNSIFQQLLEKCNVGGGSPKNPKVRLPSSVLTIVTNTSETLSLDPQDLSYIKGNDNYCTVHWHEDGVLQSRILRITIKKLVEQLRPFDFILQCHRSYLINLNETLQITGNAKGYFFESPNFPVRVPVSRSKNSYIKEMRNST